MTRLSWDNTGSRYFEAGVDRGVLYPKNSDGVPWNGLISVKETPAGGAPTPYYADGIKYLNAPGREEFAGTIEAFTAPDEFAACDGTLEIYEGMFVHQQRRQEFHFSYRTGLGNDLESLDYGYKIHLVYNALASPSDRANNTLSNSPDPMTLSWDFETTPVFILGGYLPTAHVVIDSTKTRRSLIDEVEATLYGTDSEPPTILSIADLLDLFSKWHTPLEIDEAITTGLAGLVSDGLPDLNGNPETGLYFRPRLSRLEKEATDGLYNLET